MFTARCWYPPNAVHIELPADAQISSLVSRREHFATKLTETTIDNRGCYKIIKELLHSNKHSTKRDAAENQKMCDAFYNFSSKIAAIATKIKCILDSDTRRTSVPHAHITPMRFTRFDDISDDEAILEIIDIPDKTSPMDYISTSILKDGCDVFGSLIAMLANQSLSQGKFLTMFKVSQVTSPPKIPGIYVNSNSRWITNVNTIGKILERLTRSEIDVTWRALKTLHRYSLHIERFIRPKPTWLG